VTLRSDEGVWAFSAAYEREVSVAPGENRVGLRKGVGLGGGFFGLFSGDGIDFFRKFLLDGDNCGLLKGPSEPKEPDSLLAKLLLLL